MKRHWWYLTTGLLYIAIIAFTIWAYPALPERVPSHWNIAGEIDAYSDPFTSSVFVPILTAVVAVLLIIIAQFEKNDIVAAALVKMSTVIVGFMGAVHVVTTCIALGYPLVLERYLSISIGLLFIIIGRMMYDIPPNGFFGIRTFWTLSNPVVWKESHHIGSRWMVGAGVATMVLAVLPIPAVFLMGGMLAAILVSVTVPMIYAYRRYHELVS